MINRRSFLKRIVGSAAGLFAVLAVPCRAIAKSRTQKPQQKEEPKPPSSLCPSCWDSNVDVNNGELKCHNCGAEYRLGMTMEITMKRNTCE